MYPPKGRDGNWKFACNRTCTAEAPGRKKKRANEREREEKKEEKNTDRQVCVSLRYRLTPLSSPRLTDHVVPSCVMTLVLHARDPKADFLTKKAVWVRSS